MAALCGIAALSASGPLSAFTVASITYGGVFLTSSPIHESITQDALKASTFQATLSNGTMITFAAPAVNEIAEANHQTDTKFMDNSEVHFDRENFSQGQTRLQGLRANVVTFAKAAAVQNYPQGFSGVRQSLGMALHSVQDFYAHSTWVETGHTNLAPLGQPGALPETLTAQQIGNTCSIGGLISSAALTTGYFDTTQVTGNGDWRYYLIPYNKCKHGSSTAASSNILTGAGINKDSPVRNNYPAAKELATQATAQFVKDVLADLAGNDKAICGLLLSRSPECTTPPVLISDNFGNRQFCSFNGTGPNRSVSCTGAAIGSNRFQNLGKAALRFYVPTGFGPWVYLTSVEVPVYIKAGSSRISVSVLEDNFSRELPNVPRAELAGGVFTGVKSIDALFTNPTFTTLRMSFSLGAVVLRGGEHYWVEVSAPLADTDAYWTYGPIAGFGNLATSTNGNQYEHVGDQQPALQVVITPQ